jgi:thiamine-phosphate pyrophosphorylase
LLVITGSSLSERNLIKTVYSACKSGVKAVQLRSKALSSKDILSLAKKLRTVTKKYKSLLLINDRLDIAVLSGADGIHSPEGGIDSRYVKDINLKLITGKSIHSLTAAKKAEKEGYDYLLFGPVFLCKDQVWSSKGLSILKKSAVQSGFRYLQWEVFHRQELKSALKPELMA